VRGLVAGLAGVGDHVGGHVSEHDAAGGQVAFVGGQVRVAEVMGDLLVPVVGLGDEQVRVVSGVRDRRRLAGVAGVGDDRAAQVQPQDQGGGTARMAGLEGLGLHSRHVLPAAWL
jgi:hypothetical protein